MKYAIIVMRALLVLFGTGLALGVLMFIATNNIASLGVPLAIIMAAVAPFRGGAVNTVVVVVGSMLIGGNYLVTGVPFIGDSNLDSAARGIHLAALFAAVALLAYRAWFLRVS